jgi:methionine synthase II (cobalamin-independent)
LSDREVGESIQRAIQDQFAAIQDLDVEWLFVNGQPRSDIVSIFAAGCGLTGSYLPYQVTQKVRHNGPIIVRDIEVAARATGGRPLKAHITGPTLIAESCDVIPGTPAYDLYAPPSLRQLTLDLARALAEEARSLFDTPGLPLTHLQIDEPTLVHGADLALSGEAIGIISEVARARSIPVILHVCGDISDIMLDLLQMPVDILNLVDVYLNAVPWLDADMLADHDKRLAIGCIPVDREELPSTRWLVRELAFAMERYGAENVWGLSPYCGLRQCDSGLAQRRMKRLAEVTADINDRFGWLLEESR